MLAVLNLVPFRGGSAPAFQNPWRRRVIASALNTPQVIRDAAALFDILPYTCGGTGRLNVNI